jgi:hypothetical protein
VGALVGEGARLQTLSWAGLVWVEWLLVVAIEVLLLRMGAVVLVMLLLLTTQ